MKPALISFIVLLTTNCHSQTIKGRILDAETRRPLAAAHVYLVNPIITADSANITYCKIYKYKIIHETTSDSFGNYLFKSLKPATYTLITSYDMPAFKDDMFAVREGIDSNITIRAKSLYTRLFYLMVTCPFDKTKKQSFCPKCKREDKVLPILFGLPVYDSTGNIGSEKYHLAGCFVDPYCNPSRHCNRCNIDF